MTNPKTSRNNVTRPFVCLTALCERNANEVIRQTALKSRIADVVLMKGLSSPRISMQNDRAIITDQSWPEPAKIKITIKFI